MANLDRREASHHFSGKSITICLKCKSEAFITLCTNCGNDYFFLGERYIACKRCNFYWQYWKCNECCCESPYSKTTFQLYDAKKEERERQLKEQERQLKEQERLKSELIEKEKLARAEREANIDSVKENIIVFTAITIFLISMKPIYDLTIINVTKKTYGNKFGFFDNAEVGLEMILFLVCSAVFLFIITFIGIAIKEKTKSIVPAILLLIFLSGLLYLWLRSQIIPFKF